MYSKHGKHSISKLFVFRSKIRQMEHDAPHNNLIIHSFFFLKIGEIKKYYQYSGSVNLNLGTRMVSDGKCRNIINDQWISIEFRK